MRYKLPDNSHVFEGRAFEHGGVAYAANWLTLAGEADLQARGIVADQEPAPEVVLMPLATLKAQLAVDIDLQAERARLRYITAGSGQALEYRETAEEAARYVATSGAGSYPMLQASVDAGEAASLAEAAALIAQREAAWATVGASIRQKRIAAKRAIAAADTAEAAQAASQVEWP